MLYQTSAKHVPVPPAIHLIIAVAFIGFVITGAQTLLIFFRGDSLCLNEGCEIVESLTTVPPLFFNLAGAVYFFAVFRCFAKGRRGSGVWLNCGRLMLLSGLATEGVLVSFQHFVAQTFCSYCLIIFSIICLMTILTGLRQIVAGLFVFTAVLVGFSSLQFSPVGSSEMPSLDDGTFARLAGTDRAADMYLFYSASCVHCEEVIDTLDDDLQCGLGFNPVGEVKIIPVPGAVRSAGYSPEVNKRYLKNLGILEIPVLAVKKSGEIRILKGKKLILDYLDANCRPKDLPEAGMEQSSIFSGGSTTMSISPYYTPPVEDESCSVDEECDDPLQREVGQ